MKKALAILLVFAALAGCKTYELDTSFSVPTELDAPEDVLLDVSSSERVVFFWSGGSAADGGIVLYEVLFDRAGGNFSAPLATFQSDRGSQSRLTLTHAQLNTIAREGGLSRNQSGNFIWTVKASRGGVVKPCGLVKEITLTRGNDIDVLPTSLVPEGTAFAEDGRSFIPAGSGVFAMITRLQAGTMGFSAGADNFYVDGSSSIVFGDDYKEISYVPSSGLALVKVDFNTLKVSIDELATTVQAQWAATNTAFVILSYKGEGVFSGKGTATFLGPGRPGTPSWCTWTEERYSFITEVNGLNVRWGSGVDDPNGAILPDGTPEYYYIHQVAKTDWANLWKMDHSFDQKTVLMSIFLNEEGMLTHSIEETEPDPEPDPEAAFTLTGAGAEVQNQEFVKIDEGVYRIYAKLPGGTVSVSNGTDSYPFDLPATPDGADATRLTVNVNNSTFTAEVVNKVSVLYAADFNEIVKLTYKGEGVWSGTGGAWYRSVSWGMDERYSFIPTIDGAQTLCWGRKSTVDAENRPDGAQSADYFDCEEAPWQQWEHLWKLPTAANNGATTTITLYTNKNGIMTHTVTVE